MGTAKKNAVKCVRDMCDFPPACYRLASDGRKWKQLCEDRQKLATWLAIKADGDGTRIFPGIKKMMKAMGWSRRKTCYVLRALQVIGCVVRESEDGKKLKTSEHGTARRKFNLEPLLRANLALEQGEEFAHAVAGVQDSPEPECKIGVSEVQDSIPEVQDWSSQSARFDSQSASLGCTQPTPNRHQPTQTTEADGVGKDLIGEKSSARTLSIPLENSSAAIKNISQPPIIQEKGNISVGGRTDGDGGAIMAEFNRAMVRHTGRPLNANESHRKAAVEFYRKHGSLVAIAAWAVYLMNSPDKIKRAEGKEENRAWRLHDFIANGDAEIYAERVRPCIERGLTSHAVIDAFSTVDTLKQWNEIAKNEPALVEDAVQVLNQFQREELSSTIKAWGTQKSNYAPKLKGFLQFLTTTHLQSAQVS